MKTPMVRVRVPASTANLGPGFDALGMALSLYAWIEMEELPAGEKTHVELIGSELQGLPVDESNLIVKVAYQVYDAANMPRVPLCVRIYSEIPLTRGLGSSASAIVGGMVAANALLGEPLSFDEIFKMSTEREDHPDNVGAALYGGFVVNSWDGEGHQPNYLRLSPNANLAVMVAIPHFELSTEKARAALPAMYSRKDAIFNLSRTAMIVAALTQGRLEYLADAMRDRIHQPYRAALVPGLQMILDGACNHGSIGAALSGAGPTILCFVDDRSGKHDEIEEFVATTLHNENIEATIMWLEPSSFGVEVEIFMEPYMPRQNTLLEFAQERSGLAVGEVQQQ